MKKLLFAFIFLILTAKLFAGNNDKINVQDSLKKIEQTKDILTKVNTYFNIGLYYTYYKGDSSVYYYNKAEKLCLDNNLIEPLVNIYFYLSNVMKVVIGNYPASLHYAMENLKYVNLMVDKGGVVSSEEKLKSRVWPNYNVALTYAFLGNKKKALEYFYKATNNQSFIEFNKEIDRVNPILGQKTMMNGIASQLLVIVNEYDSALQYNERARALNQQLPADKQLGYAYVIYADILTHQKKYAEAIKNYQIDIPFAIKDNFFKDILEGNYGIANNFYYLKQYDSSIVYANKVIKMSSEITFNEGLLKTNLLLYNLYKLKGKGDSALKYLEATEELREKIFNNTKANDAQNMAINEEAKQREIAEEKTKQRKILIITALGLMLLAVGIYLNGKRKQRERLRQIEEDRKNNELAAARDLQQSMLPKENPKRADLDIATFIRSSTEVGGDYYDFFVQPDGVIYSVCGDATGHGVTSGMMVSVTKAGLNGISPVKPNKILQRLNGVVKRIDLGTLRMSLNIAEITNDEVFLSSAAMPPIYLYKAATKQVEEFMNNGLPLGGLRDEDFVLENRKFEAGDVLVQLSDGLPEAPNLAGEMYDYERLSSLIQNSCHLSAQEIIDVLIKSVDEWMQGKRNPDDITLVVTKKK